MLKPEAWNLICLYWILKPEIWYVSRLNSEAWSLIAWNLVCLYAKPWSLKRVQDKEKARRERRCEMLKGDILPAYTVLYVYVHISYRKLYVYHAVNHTYILLNVEAWNMMGQDKEKARRERRCEMLRGDILPVYTLRTCVSYLDISICSAILYVYIHILHRKSHIYYTVNQKKITLYIIRISHCKINPETWWDRTRRKQGGSGGARCSRAISFQYKPYYMYMPR